MTDAFDDRERDVAGRMAPKKAEMLEDAEADFEEAEAALARRKEEIDEIFEDEDSFSAWMHGQSLEREANIRRTKREARGERIETFFALVGFLAVGVCVLALLFVLFERFGVY